MKISILEKTDIPTIVSAFENSGWQTKPANVFEQYLEEQHNNKRACFVAFMDNEFAGYITLKWQGLSVWFQ